MLGFDYKTNDSLEHLFNVKFSKCLKDILKSKSIPCEVFDRPELGNNSEITSIINYVNENKPKLLVSIHGNASGSGNWKNLEARASGTVVLYYPSSTTGKKIANDIAKNLKNIRLLCGGPDNRAEHTMQSTVAVLKKTSCPAVLIEVCFYDNIDDLYWSTLNMQRLANGVFEAIRNYV